MAATLARVFYGRGGIVASEHPLASYAGYQVLSREGTAADAAVAVSLTLAVTLPHLGGIGGDFFALIRLPDDDVLFIDGSGPAPQRLTRELMVEKGYKTMPERGPLTINVPGMVDGLYILWRRHGTFEWKELVKTAIEAAKKGFGVTPSLASAINRLCKDVLNKDPGSIETYCKNSVSVGSPLAFRGLARALEMVAEDPRTFYDGDIAEKIVSYVESRGGVLSIDDLRAYHALPGEAISITYRGLRIYEMPPPTQGITSLHVLRLLEDYDLSKIPPSSTERVKLHLEAYYAAYWARDNYVTDPRYMKVSVGELLSHKFIEEMKNSRRLPMPQQGDGDTTFFAVVDRDGMMIAGIQSLFHPFGSGVTEPFYQITLNNRAQSFSLDPNHANSLEPGKKTMHTLSAMIVRDDKKVYTIGLSGGHFRPQLHSLILTNIVDYRMGFHEALDYPRFIWYPGTRRLRAEEGLDVAINGYSTEKAKYPSRLGVAAIAVINEETGLLEAYTDIRGDGIPIGLPS